MAVAATDIWLDSLASKVQRHEVAQAVRHNFHFATSVGPCYLCITCKEPAKSASNDSWVGVFVHWWVAGCALGGSSLTPCSCLIMMQRMHATVGCTRCLC